MLKNTSERVHFKTKFQISSLQFYKKKATASLEFVMYFA